MAQKYLPEITEGDKRILLVDGEPVPYCLARIPQGTDFRGNLAVGGRGTLIGPVIGAFLVNGAKSFFTVAFPEYWLFFLGLMFVLVTMFLPQGLYGLLTRVRRSPAPASTPAAGADLAAEAAK